MEEPTKSWDKSIDSKAKWSSDLDYLARYNWFIGNAQIQLAQSWNTAQFPTALLDALYFMESALNDCYVLVSLDTFQEAQNKIANLENQLIPKLPGMVSYKERGFPADFIKARREVNEVFLLIRDVGHKAGIDIKQQFNVKHSKAALQKLIGEPKL